MQAAPRSKGNKTMAEWTLGVAVFAAVLFAAIPTPAQARDCSQIEDRSDRVECLTEELKRTNLRLEAHICAHRLTKLALATLGLEMGFTARTTPAQIITKFATDPGGQAQMINKALARASELIGQMIHTLVVVDDENEREVLSTCVETMSDRKRGTVVGGLSSTTTQPIDLDWLDDVMSSLDEPPELPPARVELGVDCTEPFTVSLPDDVLTECETGP